METEQHTIEWHWSSKKEAGKQKISRI
jgi:hypothetical protein